ncbi:MAG TPA: glucose/galactose MFS transporter [Bacteroidales bacterium]|nr:glucose/galactose MFS transporter [Bacteroidales bacterium]
MSTPLLRTPSGKSYLIPFLLISSLYLLWGCAHGLLDVLNKHFQGFFDMSKAESGFVQFSTYLAYFIMAIPAGLLLRKVGYKRGLFAGLLLFALGAFAFVPAAFAHSPIPFLIALFVLACGLCIIETGAHPYATIMGPTDTAAQRINVAAAFNGVGWIIGPLIGGTLIFGAAPGDALATARPYVLVGGVVMLVALILAFIKLPEIVPESASHDEDTPTQDLPLWKHAAFVGAVIAQFCYVAAQTGIFSFFINYVMELFPDLSSLQASRLLSMGGMGLFFIGRLSSSLFMRWMKPANLLTLFAGLSVVCMLLVIASWGMISFIALAASFFFMSMMFPTIFALGVRGLGVKTKQASSYIVMGVGGGAVAPLLMGWLGESTMAVGFVVPLICFLIIGVYGWRQRTPKSVGV